ncbi:gluconate 2-dehydrogenase subunit 3 family protein [Qipengyuania sp. 1XM1-15A]|uniref:gluconate 2-dehydrogenase subunit 3 family protein n=1 Tax=Qipengyuania xiamenensis TaxID=2867237 RepID=UPI001C86D6A6|nr:gluconate 2-dehydrogenase subunit 3 family protein [Qipengyuania xiamenensis]MBX7532921.1 gluconate 2-dehydrogenase subunit 3 family protein [Qipengyuania xiamenensis]
MIRQSAFSRREILRNSLISAGLVFAASGCSEPQSKPLGLSEERFAILAATSNAMLPGGDGTGALDAGLPRIVVDLLDEWASAQTRTGLVSAIDAIGALHSAGVGFSLADPTTQSRLLETHDIDMMDIEKQGDEGRWYLALKNLLIAGFYHSEIALNRELDWDHDPGGWTPSIPLTRATRVQFWNRG